MKNKLKTPNSLIIILIIGIISSLFFCQCNLKNNLNDIENFNMRSSTALNENNHDVIEIVWTYNIPFYEKTKAEKAGDLFFESGRFFYKWMEALDDLDNKIINLQDGTGGSVPGISLGNKGRYTSLFKPDYNKITFEEVKSKMDEYKKSFIHHANERDILEYMTLTIKSRSKATD